MHDLAVLVHTLGSGAENEEVRGPFAVGPVAARNGDGRELPAGVLHFGRNCVARADLDAGDQAGGVRVELEPGIVRRGAILAIGIRAGLLDGVRTVSIGASLVIYPCASCRRI